MRNWFARRTLFTKLFLLLMSVVIVFAALTFSVLSSEIESVVSQQINQQTRRDALNIANTKLQNQLMNGMSILVSIRVNENLLDHLATQPRTAGERNHVAAAVAGVVSDAFYALERDQRIAVISQFGDVYANWGMYDSASLLRVRDTYYEMMREGTASGNTMYAGLFPDFQATQSGVARDVFAQIMPLVRGKERTLCGIAMALVPEQDLYEAFKFEQESEHTTFLVDARRIILSARDKSVLGRPVDEVLAEIGADPERIAASQESFRTRTMVIDVLSSDYVWHRTKPILKRVATYVLLILLVVVIVCYIVTRGVTRPLAALTKSMVSGSYAAFLKSSEGDSGKNEVLLLERGFSVMRADIENLLEENKRKERQKRATEIAALQAQIQPHFLFNTLNTARCSILNRHDEKAAELLYKLTMLLRMTLVKGDEMITLVEELETIDYYLDIVRMRHSTSFECIKQIEPVTEDFLVPKLLLQPVVENCVVHGFLPAGQGGKIFISTQLDSAFFYIRISNNGCVIERDIDLRDGEQKHNRFTGLGITNVNQRLKLYYGERSGLRLYREGEETVALLFIALSEPEDEKRLPGGLSGEEHT